MAQQPGFDFFGFGDRLGGEGEVREKFWRTAKKAARQIPFMPRYAELIYNGFWFSPERLMLQAMIDKSQEDVEGTVRLKLYKGNVMPMRASAATPGN